MVAKWSVYSRIGLAEREGFEPSVPGASPVQRFSNSLYLLRRPAIPTAYSCTTAPNLTQGDLIRQLRDTVRGTDPSSQKPRHPVKIFVPLRVQFSRNFRSVTLGQCVMATNQRLGLIFGDRTATPYELWQTARRLHEDPSYFNWSPKKSRHTAKACSQRFNISDVR